MEGSLISYEVVCRVGEHQHRWHIDVQISHIHKVEVKTKGDGDGALMA